jgi:(p)ppGpp synthase/HD superfamily hydrolase
MYTSLTKKALRLCFEAHKDQLDKSGLPYVFHPFHLAEQMETEAEICTALLHDIVEDTDYTFDDLGKMGFPPEVMEALQLLTRTEDVDYMTYVGQLKDNAIARKVKLADLHHNSDLARLEKVTDRDLKRLEKYKRAEQILLR